uniref:Uncharacterized protein n=1 Tax=Rhizophora mucronata TaxID=61149 RepID=A0A2P2NCX8_RHIMU
MILLVVSPHMIHFQ